MDQPLVSYAADVATARVLIVGLDPHALPGIDVEAVDRGLAYGLERVRVAGYLVEQLLVPLDEAALDQIKQAGVSQAWDVVVIGGGIRKPEPLLEFFEAVVNLVRTGVPAAKIAFNADGGTSLEAVHRVLP
ncbi:hypothetical protein [Frankia sp. AgB32]|uniref:hypothetical protein n=1 Tax=Frankia sp. AgB32 TaxID=631119 RepID=UPI00200C5F7D|nr:hypothetical protein [Frankia sp. AgB32]MCK9897218.1 hypothetical protein [Frankia sp. AgB32]